MRTTIILAALFLSAATFASQAPPPLSTSSAHAVQPGAAQQQPLATPAGPGQAGQRQGGSGGRGRGAVQVMTLTTAAWPDGGVIPVKFSQAGDEVSPPLAWDHVPATAASFALIVHDIDAATGDGTSDVLHWLVWNIPGTARSLAEGLPQGAEQADGTRQISQTGPNYRGPAAPASGPPHHYVFELYALDAPLDVKPVGASVAEARAAVMAAMAGHVRGKATMIGLFKRASTQ